MFFKIIERIKLRFPPNPDWRFQKQVEPPVFRWARMISEKRFNKEVAEREEQCSEIIRNSKKYCDFVEGKVALIVLSCRRWWTLERLMKSMEHFWGEVDKYQPFECILVDNGSGDDLIKKTKQYNFFNRIIAHPQNLGMVGALRDIFSRTDAEYILLVEDDFIFDFGKPFLNRCVQLFKEYPEIGIIRLKNQNNWWKPHRVIAPLRRTSCGDEFWTWLPSRDGMLNVWAAGSVMFRKASYCSTGELPSVEANMTRDKKMHQGFVYECVYGKKYNKQWLAAKMQDCCVFSQPNDSKPSQGWGR